MIGLWDTSVASRVHPRTDALDYVVDRRADGRPVRIAAPVVLEIVYGYQLKVAEDPRFDDLIAWFARLIASGAFTVVAFDDRAALVAGRTRGVVPHPPYGRREQRSKTMRQAAWLLDIQIAATAFASGLDVVTENRADFEALAETLSELFPDADPLIVLDPPTWN